MNDRQKLIDELWERHLQGGIVLSEFSTFLAREGELTFLAGADLATILVCQAAVESHLKFENINAARKSNLRDLIDQSDLPDEIKDQLHLIRRYRNRWVHISDPANDQDIQMNIDSIKSEQFEISKKAIGSLIQVLCHNPWI